MTEFHLPHQCPICGSEEFFQPASGQRILSFHDDIGGIFVEDDWEPLSGLNLDPIYCIKCKAEIDELVSMREKRVVLVIEEQLQELKENWERNSHE